MAYKIYKELAEVERYANRRYRTWDQRWISNREQAIVKRLFLGNSLGGKILDVPCGYGRFYQLLSNYGSVYAADLNHYAVVYYNKNICSDPEAVEAPADDLPFADTSFDGIFCFRLLQHMHKKNERIAILREFSRISRQWIIASFYLSSWLHRAHRKIIKMPSRITMISKNDLIEEARDAGLQLKALHSVLPGLHAHRIGLFIKS